MTLKQWRRAAGLTQAQLAARLSVHTLTVSSWECRTKRPSADMMTAIRSLTDGAVQPNDFFDTEVQATAA
jgi:transcriptional regulator with XRE-family HTH domain